MVFVYCWLIKIVPERAIKIHSVEAVITTGRWWLNCKSKARRWWRQIKLETFIKLEFMDVTCRHSGREKASRRHPKSFSLLLFMFVSTMTISAIFIAFISSLSTLALLICIAKACTALAVRILTIFTVICPMASQLLLGDLCATFSETFPAVVYGQRRLVVVMFIKLIWSAPLNMTFDGIFIKFILFNGKRTFIHKHLQKIFEKRGEKTVGILKRLQSPDSLPITFMFITHGERFSHTKA